MLLRTPLLALLAAACVGLPAAAEVAPKPVLPTNQDVLFWNEAQRDGGFRAMEKVFPTHTVKRGKTVHALPKGAPLHVPGLKAYMDAEKTAAVVVLQNGKLRLEAYGRGFSGAGRWTSFSVAKSFTSTLAGAAVKDGYIKSIDDPVTTYLPELKGSAYDGVSIRQILTMTSGVKWNEDYTDPNSDVAKFNSEAPPNGGDPTLSYMKRLPREAPPGEKWVYKTGETNLIGVLVTHATKKTLAHYLSEKVWKPYGMEQDAAWVVGPNGQEVGGCCLSVAARDYARMGQFILEGGHGVLPKGWLEAATHKEADIGQPGMGYGYQWWTRDNGEFDARGIFGQMIHIDPKRKLVVVILSNWDHASAPPESKAREAFLTDINKAVDAR
jgi:CubicO group peptidase (beta-lactamase class C family)